MDKVEHKVTNHGPGSIMIRREGCAHRFIEAGQTYIGYCEAIEAGQSVRYSVEPVPAPAES